MNPSFGICSLSLVPVRAEPAHSSEMVNQLLFGDLLKVVALEEKWAHVRTLYDDYPGWIDRKQLTELQEQDVGGWTGRYVTGTGISQLRKAGDQGSSLWLAPGSTVPAGTGSIFSINHQQFLSPENVSIPDTATFAGQVIPVAESFLNTPYLWGGKSPFGIDCSGFCQVVFKMMGIRLPRDASQQALKGEAVHFLAEAQAGDLAFFDNKEGIITHTGILIDPATIIHASGKVKIDQIDSQGIYSDELGMHTHQLRIIKRYR